MRIVAAAPARNAAQHADERERSHGAEAAVDESLSRADPPSPNVIPLLPYSTCGLGACPTLPATLSRLPPDDPTATAARCQATSVGTTTGRSAVTSSRRKTEPYRGRPMAMRCPARSLGKRNLDLGRPTDSLGVFPADNPSVAD
jgi:hypothetical protein